jgi:hypothetical protein
VCLCSFARLEALDICAAAAVVCRHRWQEIDFNQPEKALVCLHQNEAMIALVTQSNFVAVSQVNEAAGVATVRFGLAMRTRVCHCCALIFYMIVVDDVVAIQIVIVAVIHL